MASPDNKTIKNYPNDQYQTLAEYMESTEADLIGTIVEEGFKSIVKKFEQEFLQNVQTYIQTMNNSIEMIRESFNPTEEELNNFKTNYLNKNSSPRMDLKSLAEDSYDIVADNPILIMQNVQKIVNEEGVPELLPFFTKDIWLDCCAENENSSHFRGHHFYSMLLVATKENDEIQNIIKNCNLIHELRAINFIIKDNPIKDSIIDIGSTDSLKSLRERFNLDNPDYTIENLNHHEKTQMIRCVYSQAGSFSQYKTINDIIQQTIAYQIENNVSIDEDDLKFQALRYRIDKFTKNEAFITMNDYLVTMNKKINIQYHFDDKITEEVAKESPVMKL